MVTIVSRGDAQVLLTNLHGPHDSLSFQKYCWDSEIFSSSFPSLFLTFHRPINLLSYHFHTYIWVSPYYFPLYSF
jgi:hypothetical protein